MVDALNGAFAAQDPDEVCVGYKNCCGMFTTLHKRKAHYSRLRSTTVPSVACQTTEGEYHLLSY